ncbi:MAG TPA: bacillithiol biosynthesis BshC, partial [Fibrobacteria bacterium]|nr:bacillithiol biosynthesis BshC [Fibrobacteria bacterium]
LAWAKAMTTVAWARACAARLGRPVIPVFWAAGDDSDLAESNAAEFLEPDAPAPGAAMEFADPEAAVPMSLRLLEAKPLRALWEKLPPSWDDPMRARAREAYAPGRSLTEAFVRLLQPFLGPEGALFVDGLSAARRPESQALLRRIASEGAAFQEALLRGTARLRETLSLDAQVPVRPGAVPVFLFEGGERKRLFFSDSGRVYAAGAEDMDLRAALAEKTLLHSALSRPLVVDTLFPLLGHVLGPAETRYFAQLADVFPAFGRSFPLLAPRGQALAVPESGLRALETLGFTAADLLDLRPSRVREKLTEEAWARHPASTEFPDAEYRAFRGTLSGYQERRFAGGNFEAALRRLDRSFGNYREQARRRVFAEDAAAGFRALQPLLRWLAGGQQDRHLNLLSLRAALGEAGFAALTERFRAVGEEKIGAATVLEADMPGWKEKSA